jgi:hypothetical protein
MDLAPCRDAGAAARRRRVRRGPADGGADADGAAAEEWGEERRGGDDADREGTIRLAYADDALRSLLARALEAVEGEPDAGWHGDAAVGDPWCAAQVAYGGQWLADCGWWWDGLSAPFSWGS